MKAATQNEIDWPLYTRLYGRHSNIPECCIEEFIEGSDHIDYSIGYRRCRKCIEAGRLAKIHFCTLPECEEFLRSIGGDYLVDAHKRDEENRVELKAPLTRSG